MIDNKEKVKKKLEATETDMMCPTCGEKIIKQLHVHKDYNTMRMVYKYFWCINYCDITCSNCIHGVNDTHGDGCDFICINYSKWTPIKRVEKNAN